MLILAAAPHVLAAYGLVCLIIHTVKITRRVTRLFAPAGR